MIDCSTMVGVRPQALQNGSLEAEPRIQTIMQAGFDARVLRSAVNGSRLMPIQMTAANIP